VRGVQTDNGSAFWGNLQESLRGNRHVERFNRTLEEEFMKYGEWMLKGDLREFNKELMRYLIWCNTERIHKGLKKVCPWECICYKFKENFHQSKILWTHTFNLTKVI
ncbi:MAG: integrase core domain-containing protein, partial [Candidatus Kryptonium sp.]